MEWEATTFGRPVLTLVLVASLALFPVCLIPSGPSMWLAGMIFGYGLGFVIIMGGTTIGMVLPYLIGLLFRDRVHASLFVSYMITNPLKFCVVFFQSRFYFLFVIFVSIFCSNG